MKLTRGRQTTASLIALAAIASVLAIPFATPASAAICFTHYHPHKCAVSTSTSTTTVTVTSSTTSTVTTSSTTETTTSTSSSSTYTPPYCALGLWYGQYTNQTTRQLVDFANKTQNQANALVDVNPPAWDSCQTVADPW